MKYITGVDRVNLTPTLLNKKKTGDYGFFVEAITPIGKNISSLTEGNISTIEIKSNPHKANIHTIKYDGNTLVMQFERKVACKIDDKDQYLKCFE